MLEQDLETVVAGRHARVRRFRSTNALVLVVPFGHPLWETVEATLAIDEATELEKNEIECAEMDEDGDWDFSYPEP